MRAKDVMEPRMSMPGNSILTGIRRSCPGGRNLPGESFVGVMFIFKWFGESLPDSSGCGESDERAFDGTAQEAAAGLFQEGSEQEGVGIPVAEFPQRMDGRDA